MKLLYSPASPYSAKARMAARYLELNVEAVKVDTAAAPALLLDNNPLGKIPVLLLDDGRSVYDSVAIMHFLDRESGGRLYPSDRSECTEVEILEALCDGIMDSLLAIIYERRSRPEAIVHQPWIDKQWEKVLRALDYLNANLPDINGSLHGGHFALAALLGYLDLRFADRWQDARPNLTAWPNAFTQAFPAYADMKSVG